MELTKEYIKEHLNEFVCKAASYWQGKEYIEEGEGRWNFIHGEWWHHANVEKIESDIHWVYAIKPYHEGSVITGVKPVKGFIIQHCDKILFTSAAPLNTYWHKYHGHSVEFDSDWEDFYGDLHMFTTKDEATAAGNVFKHEHELEALQIKINDAEKILNEAQMVYNNLKEQKEKLLSKRK